MKVVSTESGPRAEIEGMLLARVRSIEVVTKRWHREAAPFVLEHTKQAKTTFAAILEAILARSRPAPRPRALRTSREKLVALLNRVRTL